MSKESLEWWTGIFENLTYGFALAGAVSGLLYLWFNRPLTRIVEAERQAATIEIARLNDHAAQLALQLAEVTRKQGPRFIDHTGVTAALVAKPTGTATILYVPDDVGEPYALATQFWASLVNAKWVAKPPMPLTVENDAKRDLDHVRFDAVNRFDTPTLRIGDKRPEGVTLIMRTLDTPGAAAALKAALVRAGIGIGLGADTTMPADNVRILVGRKP